MKIESCLIYIFVLSSCLPSAPKYPYFDNNIINKEAKVLSESLENYIRLSYEGKASDLLAVKVLPSFDATEYRFNKWVGKGEVTILDADIVPKNGNKTPFLVGAKR